MKLLANPKDKGGNQEKFPAKKKLSEFARTLKKVDVGAALRTMRAAFALAVDRSTLACVASGAAACALASLLIERCDFARSVAFLSYSIPQFGWVTLSCCLTAMLIAECICRAVAGTRRRLFSRLSRPSPCFCSGFSVQNNCIIRDHIKNNLLSPCMNYSTLSASHFSFLSSRLCFCRQAAVFPTWRQASWSTEALS